MSITLGEAVRMDETKRACQALVDVKNSDLLTSAQLEALTGLVLQSLVQWVWREIMRRWEQDDSHVPGQSRQAWLMGKTLHDVVYDKIIVSELIELAQMVSLDQNNHGLTDFMDQLGKRLYLPTHPRMQPLTSELGDGKQTIRFAVW